MTAEKLREAARSMRSRAEKVFAPDGDDHLASWAEEYGPAAGMNALERDEAEFVASWHPAVALAVADWLESEAGYVERHAPSDLTTGHALAVASAYLNEVPS